mgnify:CR=1 FL=1
MWPDVQARHPRTLQSVGATVAVEYLGHGANTGGLQRHSVGAEYPYTVAGTMQHGDAQTQWYVQDLRTGNRGVLRATYKQAEIDLWALKVRNMMHG